MPDVCTSCKRRIRWAITRNGKPVPLDPEPVDGGNYSIDEAGLALVVPEAERRGPLFLSHFATCLYADEHRRRR